MVDMRASVLRRGESEVDGREAREGKHHGREARREARNVSVQRMKMARKPVVET